MEAHLTFDANVSVTVTLDLEAIHNMTGTRLDILEGMQPEEVEELVLRIPRAELLDLGKGEFQIDRHLIVDRADMELAVTEVY